VSSEGFFTWAIKLEHSLKGSEDNLLEIQFPSDYSVEKACSIEGNDDLGAGRSCEGDQISNTITIKDFTSGDYEGGDLLSFTLGPVVLPVTVSGGKGTFKITSFILHSDTAQAYSVDTSEFD